MKKAVTLIELILAIALMGVVILGVTSFDLGSRRFLQASERKTQALNEVTLLMDRISKDALLAVGSRNAPAAASNGLILTINQDLRDDNTINARDTDGIVDTVVSYALVGNQIRRTRTIVGGVTTNEMVTNPGRQATFTPAVIPVPAVANTAQVTLTLLFDRTRALNAFDNPQVRVQSNIEVPGWSLN